MLHEVNIASMAIDPTSNTPIIILKSVKGDQAVPIWIGLLEATSIASALRDIKFDRPMTHDLFKNFIIHINRRTKPKGDGNRIAWTGIHVEAFIF